MILSTDGTGFIAAMSEVKGKEQEARGEALPLGGAGGTGSLCLPAPRAHGGQGRRELLRWGVPAPSKAFQNVWRGSAGVAILWSAA